MMDTYMSINYWLFEPNFWVIIGIILIVVDIFLASFFLLPIGVSALITAALIFFDTSQFLEQELFTTWRNILLCFAALSVISIFLIQFTVKSRRKKEQDINQY